MTIRDRLASAASVVRASLQPLPATQGDVAQVADLTPDARLALGLPADLGATGAPITRREAMRVPAFARGRQTICGTVGMLNLVRVRGDERDADHPLVSQPDPRCTRQHTWTWLTDDLLCRGIAWARVLDRDATGYPTHLERVAGHRVSIGDQPDAVYIDGRRVDAEDVKRFDAPHEGVLAFGADVLRAALALELAVGRYADNPTPTSILYDKRPIEADVTELDPAARDDLLKRWREGNRRDPVRWLNRMVGHERLSYTPTELDLTAARQQAAVQVARLLNMPSRQVNAPSETGMTYQNVSADRLEVIEVTCAPYLVAIEQRLSMPDMTPRTTTVTWDREAYVVGTPADRLTNAAAAVAAGLMSVTEARRHYLGLGPADDLPTTPQEQP